MEVSPDIKLIRNVWMWSSMLWAVATTSASRARWSMARRRSTPHTEQDPPSTLPSASSSVAPYSSI